MWLPINPAPPVTSTFIRVPPQVDSFALPVVR